MVVRDSLVAFLDKYLEIDSIPDSSWNGLQIEGSSRVRKIMCAVDSGMETFTAGMESGADFIIVHHGLFWKKAHPRITGFAKERIDI
ncbi:MAG: Nif3-like dinuclear metal center hexameric protein, partial [Chitinivibrionales bacterium]|nr:Nif3-like dinuclear metal center hexameric protein [Chitinivibrionales bacterium]